MPNLYKEYRHQTIDFPKLHDEKHAEPTTSKMGLYSDQLKDKNTKNNLFSMDELIMIFEQATEQLQRCSTKMEQMRILVSLLSYACK